MCRFAFQARQFCSAVGARVPTPPTVEVAHTASTPLLTRVHAEGPRPGLQSPQLPGRFPCGQAAAPHARHCDRTRLCWQICDPPAHFARRGTAIVGAQPSQQSKHGAKHLNRSNLDARVRDELNKKWSPPTLALLRYDGAAGAQLAQPPVSANAGAAAVLAHVALAPVRAHGAPAALEARLALLSVPANASSRALSAAVPTLVVDTY